MTPGKFNWLLHTMLFLQTQYVLKKQKEKISTTTDDDESDGDDGNDM
jgi:hypothetical protein